MYSRLMSFLNHFNQIYSRQFGFRKAHSTINTLINIVERIRESLDVGKFACGVFVDLQKAFDTVDHEILLSKLDHLVFVALKMIGSSHTSQIVSNLST